MVYHLVFPPNSPDSVVNIQCLLQSPTRLTLPTAVAFMCQLNQATISWCMKVTQSCLTLCNPMDYTVHGILQAGILEWVAFPFSRGIFPTQGSNPGLLHCRRILYQLRYQGSPYLDICSNTIQQVSGKLIFLIRLTFKSNRLWIKQITLHSTGGPHPISGKTLRDWTCPKKREACQLTTSGHKQQFLLGSPVCRPTLQILDFPGSTGLWANSLKEIALHICMSC